MKKKSKKETKPVEVKLKGARFIQMAAAIMNESNECNYNGCFFLGIHRTNIS